MCVCVCVCVCVFVCVRERKCVSKCAKTKKYRPSDINFSISTKKYTATKTVFTTVFVKTHEKQCWRHEKRHEKQFKKFFNLFPTKPKSTSPNGHPENFLKSKQNCLSGIIGNHKRSLVTDVVLGVNSRSMDLAAAQRRSNSRIKST